MRTTIAKRRLSDNVGLKDNPKVTSVKSICFDDSCSVADKSNATANNKVQGSSNTSDDCCHDVAQTQANPINLTVNVNSNNTDSADTNTEHPVVQPFVQNPHIVPPVFAPQNVINPNIVPPVFSQYPVQQGGYPVMYPNPNVVTPPQPINPIQVPQEFAPINRNGLIATTKLPCKEVFYKEFI